MQTAYVREKSSQMLIIFSKKIPHHPFIYVLGFASKL